MTSLSGSTAVLDYAVYPHIVEAIVDYSPWRVLNAFRRTCKAFQVRVDAIQAVHLFITSGEHQEVRIQALDYTFYSGANPADPPVVAAELHRVPALQDRDYHAWAKPGGKKAKAALDRANRSLALTRTVDLVGRGGVAFVPVSKGLSGVDVLRVYSDEDGDLVYRCGISAKTLVVCGDIGRPMRFAGENRTIIGDKVSKAVVHCRYHIAQAGSQEVPIDHTLIPIGLQRVVFVFTDWGPRGADATNVPALSGTHVSAQRWGNLISALSGVLLGGTLHRIAITMVDWQLMDPGWMGMDDFSIEQLRLLLINRVSDTVGVNLPQNPIWAYKDVHEATASIQFVTGDAYHAEVGDRAWQLEMVPLEIP